jgi:hypothetical protein
LLPVAGAIIGHDTDCDACSGYQHPEQKGEESGHCQVPPVPVPVAESASGVDLLACRPRGMGRSKAASMAKRATNANPMVTPRYQLAAVLLPFVLLEVTL